MSFIITTIIVCCSYCFIIIWIIIITIIGIKQWLTDNGLLLSSSFILWCHANLNNTVLILLTEHHFVHLFIYYPQRRSCAWRGKMTADRQTRLRKSLYVSAVTVQCKAHIQYVVFILNVYLLCTCKNWYFSRVFDAFVLLRNLQYLFFIVKRIQGNVIVTVLEKWLKNKSTFFLLFFCFFVADKETFGRLNS